MSSLRYPNPLLQLWHNSPRMMFVLWQWSICHPYLPASFVLHIAQLFFWVTIIASYSAIVKLCIRLRYPFLSISFIRSGLAFFHAAFAFLFTALACSISRVLYLALYSLRSCLLRSGLAARQLSHHLRLWAFRSSSVNLRLAIVETPSRLVVRAVLVLSTPLGPSHVPQLCGSV